MVSFAYTETRHSLTRTLHNLRNILELELERIVSVLDLGERSLRQPASTHAVIIPSMAVDPTGARALMMFNLCQAPGPGWIAPINVSFFRPVIVRAMGASIDPDGRANSSVRLKRFPGRELP